MVEKSINLPPGASKYIDFGKISSFMSINAQTIGWTFYSLKTVYVNY